ncbi:hypothetical protein [Acetivibrio mesophilus]|uniref:hypothetical protein n=1 Tax=Acetivibrio mesophilus TaxID=2487273 RepID=UPI001476EE76|nr:hypothetical protein [Acetivibrio mesophilus]HHV29594.1 hypothetical protein [Clostridium sp.]
MNQVRYYRKYPRTHMKQTEHEDTRTLDLSIAQATGVLVLTFVTGMLSACLLKKMYR